MFNPLVTQLDNMKSTYKTKLKTIQSGLKISNTEEMMREEISASSKKEDRLLKV